MVKIVIDSSVVIDYTRVGFGVLPHLLLLKKSQKVEIYIPTSVIFELWAGESMERGVVEKKIRRLLSSMKTVNLTKQVARKSGELVRRKQINSGFDAIIAATTLYLDAQLATNNVKHFKKVKGLRLFGTKSPEAST
jgi:tRNA(fMet)-specific endonuclease VapC